MPNDTQMKQVLQECRRIAVIGLSAVPARPSFGVTSYLIDHGYEIYGVRPGSEKQILGRPCFQSLDELTVPMDLINVFRNPEAIPGLVDELLAWMAPKPPAARPRALWLQEGIQHAEAEQKARRAGLIVFSNLCILKEHRRLIGRFETRV